MRWPRSRAPAGGWRMRRPASGAQRGGGRAMAGEPGRPAQPNGLTGAPLVPRLEFVWADLEPTICSLGKVG
jgi:hypothetical protein